MSVIRSFRQLDVWRRSMDLAVAIYGVSDLLPATERFGLASQLRRAAASIPANLAEGHGRTTRAFANHVSIAVGSQAEIDTLLELTTRLKLVEPEALSTVTPLLAETGRMLHGLAHALRSRCDPQWLRNPPSP